MKLSRPIKFVLLGSLSVLVLLGVGWAILFYFLVNGSSFHSNPLDTLAFNRQDWLEDRSCVDGSNRRGHMADDIVRHYLVKGMPEAQIVTLLGPPENIFSRAYVQKQVKASQKAHELERQYQERDLQASQIDTYYLGEEQNWTVDRAWLYLYLDQHGQYMGYRIFTP